MEVEKSVLLPAGNGASVGQGVGRSVGVEVLGSIGGGGEVGDGVIGGGGGGFVSPSMHCLYH